MATACGFWITCLTGGLDAWSRDATQAPLGCNGPLALSPVPPPCPRRPAAEPAPEPRS
ncbi:hypothetical protein [Neotabrizicola shimadae]|uniref:Uncharacterized protein n=1 Tax=Neotabrizicola shimadae TaxID=2807096 RepID=A0A8G0ZSI9_9RHOB|nr:hypothetical protein [Neotabrizicola shimadae]QYZ68136.1 hypothetical protein JO391_09995 [Neotabrizicola shimadae]